MEDRGFIGFNPESVPSPGYVVDTALLEENCRILKDVQEAAGIKILLALKGFSMFSTFPIIKKYLKGTCASSPDEARLGREEFGGEVHSYAAGFDESQLKAFLGYSDHFVFNSFSLLERFRPLLKEWAGKISFGIRLNPEQPEALTPLYDPSAPYSRLGTPLNRFRPELLDEGDVKIEGFHIHNLCEQNSDALLRTWKKVEANFGQFFPRLKWINLGGGHHITREDYNREELVRLLIDIRKKHNVELYLEPGEAVALNTGILVCRVLDLTENGMPLAIVDTSAACHMPDVLEMPYRPHIRGSGLPGEKKYTYRIGGLTCLAGDVIGEYSFDSPLAIGQYLILNDMAHYSMVKNNTFNGIRLPSISLYDSATGKTRVVKEFGYEDFKGRLS